MEKIQSAYWKSLDGMLLKNFITKIQIHFEANDLTISEDQFVTRKEKNLKLLQRNKKIL